MYNESYGKAFEGVINWSNTITDGWFAMLFIILMGYVTFNVGSKSRWNTPTALSAMFLISFITAMILKIFTQVNEIIIWVCLFGLGISAFFMVISNK